MKLKLDKRILNLKTSATVTTNEISNKLISEGKHVYKFGLGQTPFPPFPSMVSRLQQHAAEKDYLPVRGLQRLREAVALYEGPPYTADSVLIGPGSKELMFGLSLAVDAPLLLPQASWVSYAPQSALSGRKSHWLPTDAADGWRLQPAVLADHLDRLAREKKKQGGSGDDDDMPGVLVLNSPCNPTGAAYGDDLLRDLARVCRARGVLVLSDEIYGELHHLGLHASIAAHYREGTVVSNGISKWAGAGGWRLGWFCFPPELKAAQEAMAVIASETFTSTSAPVQHAAVAALEGGGGGERARILRAQRRVLAALGQRLAALLRAADVGDFAEPQGGFYLFVDATARCGDRLRARGMRTAGDMTQRMLEDAGVAVLPGSEFGRRPEEFSFRMSYVNFDGAGALEEVLNGETEEIDETFLKRYAPDTLEGMEQLISFLKK